MNQIESIFHFNVQIAVLKLIQGEEHRSALLYMVGICDLDMDLPGRTEKDVSLELNEGVLTIASEKTETKQIEDKSEKHDKHEEKNEAEKPQFLLRERRRTSFRRSFTLPKDIDAEGVTAGFKNGVLTVRIPRKAEVAPRKIQISIA